jgi:uncharacterized protein YndB with AHSA1/START domain
MSGKSQPSMECWPMGDVIEVSNAIAAPPAAVYAAVADVTRMGEWSPENAGATWLGGATEAKPGAQFKGHNKNGRHRWSTTCTVVTADPAREISWVVRSTFSLPVSLWKYRFIADGNGGTTVTESVEDRRGLLIRTFAPMVTGVSDRPARNRENMAATLAQLKRALEAKSSVITPPS